MGLDSLLLLVLALAVLYALHLRREAIRNALRGLAITSLVFMIALAYGNSAGWSRQESFIAAILAALVVAGFVRKRSRYIPRSERRKVIARYESTGQKFSPRIHEIDHIVPFSKGGSNIADNLRVVRRHENRSKGAKSPWWDLLGG